MAKYIFITDEEYEIAEKNGISKGNVDQRVHAYGWEIERAITQPIRKQRKHTYNQKYLDLAKENGISLSVYRYRVKEAGWDEERAATTPVLSLQEIGQMNAERLTKFTPEQIETFEKNGIPQGTVRKRLELGWSMEEAITLPALKTGQRRKHIGHKRTGDRPFWESHI